MFTEITHDEMKMKLSIFNTNTWSTNIINSILIHKCKWTCGCEEGKCALK